VATLLIVIEATKVIGVILARIAIPIALRIIVTRLTKVETVIVAVPVRNIFAIIVCPFPLIVVMNTAQIETIVLAEIIVITTVIAVQVVTRIAAVIRTEAPVTIAVPVDIPHILLNLHTFLKLPSFLSISPLDDPSTYSTFYHPTYFLHCFNFS